MVLKTERFEMRLDQRILDMVDEWRGRHGNFLSRAEAIRQLIEIGVSTAVEEPLKFSAGEKMIMSILCDVHKHLKIKDGIDPDFVESTLYGGHSWGLKWKYSGIFHGHEDSEKIVSEVGNILTMWSLIESVYAKLSPKDKAKIEKEAAPFGKDVYFWGFDGNNESEHLGVARFMINDLERFSEFKERDLNSHMPVENSLVFPP